MDPLAALRAEFDTAIQALRAEFHTYVTTANPASNRRPRPSLPDPEKLTANTLKFDTWLPAIEGKILVDGDAIGNDMAQFYYVYLHLDSSVQAMVLPQLHHARDTGVWDYRQILSQLQRVYDNPNKVREAEDRLLNLRQGDDSLSAFKSKFESVLYEARGQTWPDAAKISAFRRGLSTTIKNRLSQQLTLPNDYPGFLRVVQQLAEYSASSQNASHGPNTSAAAGTARSHPRAMDLSAVNTSSISPAPAPQVDYRASNRCFRCGGDDHRVRDCPQPPPGGVRLSAADSTN